VAFELSTPKSKHTADRTLFPHHLWQLLLAAALLLPAAWGPLWGQTPDACSVLPSVSIPESDRPTIADVRAAGVKMDVAIPPKVFGVRPKFIRTGCDAFFLYYSDTPGHAKQARSCVLAKLGLFASGTDPERAQQIHNLAIDSQGFPSKIPALDQVRLDQTDAMVLAMIYANGESVTKNLSLARQFICKTQQPPASPSVPEQLKLFDYLVATEARFDFCKDPGKGDFGRGADYVCLGMELRKATHTRQQTEAAIAAASASELRLAFAALQQAWRALDEANARMGEADCGGGNGCGGMLEAAELAFVRKWILDLDAVRNGSALAADTPASSLPIVDAELNRRYRESLADADTFGDKNGTAVREAERAWIRYREAWVAYGTLRWPETMPDQWRAWQTVEWTKALGGG
jgi:hypothetical protein